MFRITLLETDQRRNGRKTNEPSAAESNMEQLTNDLTQAKKDLQTAERLYKQLDQNTKNKDIQLKRSAETITKLKEQLAEYESQRSKSTTVDKGLLEAAETKVKTLEKQKADLIAAFKKQMKLIDVLKRQKAHLEAAKLLSFTEDEFMKTLDWAQ